jgi:hypothetical protein
MPQDIRTIVLIEAHKLYLVGGIALVLLVLWLLAPPLPSAEPAVGRLEQAYREELASLFGSSVERQCKYWPKHLYIACESVPLDMSVVAKRGWLPEGSDGPRFMRDQWRLKFICSPQPLALCRAEIWFVGSRKSPKQ